MSRAAGEFEFRLEFGDAFLELFGSLPVEVARGFQIADANFEGFALLFAGGGLGLPGVAGSH